MSSDRQPTPHLPLAPVDLMADVFRCGPDYKNWRPGGSGDWLVILTTAGVGIIRAGGVEHRLEGGEAVLFAPDAEQDYSTDPLVGRWELVWAHFQPRAHWRAWLVWPEIARGVGRLRLAPAEVAALVETSLRRAAGLIGRPLAGSRDLAMNALEEALIWAQEARTGSRWSRVDPRVRRAMDHLAAQVARPFELSELARHCGLSESRLGHLFAREAGTSPQRFAEELKLERARQLLARTNASVGEVAEACGYADAFYFARRFLRAMGRSPTAWRQAQAAGTKRSP